MKSKKPVKIKKIIIKKTMKIFKTKTKMQKL